MILNYDLKNLTGSGNLTNRTKINKIIINNSVKKITPDAFKISGHQIKEIEYHGTKELFDVLINIEKINFLE